MREIEVLLCEGGSKHWATEVAKCAEVVERSDAYGLDRFLLLFGGMGSLNDLILQRDGCPLGEETDRLQSVLAEAWELSSRLKQERGNLPRR